MRTTLTLDDDIAARLREEAARQGVPFKQVVNRAIRLGLRAAGGGQERVPYRVRPRSFGLKPGIDPTKLGQVADELETVRPKLFRSRSYGRRSKRSLGAKAAMARSIAPT